MEIQQLKFFLEVVKYKHFTIAASELCISQSYLSKRIKALENELGVKLLDRSSRSVRLTEAGSEFLDFASGIIEGRSPEILALLDASKIELAFIRTISLPREMCIKLKKNQCYNGNIENLETNSYYHKGIAWQQQKYLEKSEYFLFFIIC